MNSNGSNIDHRRPSNLTAIHEFNADASLHQGTRGTSFDTQAGRARTTVLPTLAALPLVLLVALQGSHWVPVPAANASNPRAADLTLRLDPNLAPWWELTIVPRIGEVTARKIVAYREEHRPTTDGRPVFQRAEDLARVHGIGPKTVERLRPYLQFD